MAPSQAEAMMLRCIALVGLALTLSACAGPQARRTDFRPPPDVAEGLQRYYDERLVPADGGYKHRADLYNNYQLPAYYDAQGATTCAAWARQANKFGWVGKGAALALLGVGVALTANAPPDDLTKNAWWVSIMPAGLIGWTFHWAGHGWFRQPSVALYNKRLAEKMGMQVLPEQ